MFWRQSPTWDLLVVLKIQHEQLAFYSVIPDVDGIYVRDLSNFIPG